ncbi:MAG: DUF2203 domain-containing protein [bacterium]
MPVNLQPPLKLFTVEAANRLLPGIRARLAELRAAHKTILALQGKVDIEELTGAGRDGVLSENAQTVIAALHTDLERRMESFEESLEEFHALGCELKDLGKGLVDFYTMRGGELALLCWQDGEESIAFWHPLEGGYGARQPL